MDYGIDLSLEIGKPTLYLSKPNRQTISILSEAYDIQRNVKLGNVNELLFKIPIEIDINHKLRRNPSVDLLKERYLIKYENGNDIEWYLLDKPPSDIMEEESDYKQVSCFSLPYQLADKMIKELSVVSYNATSIMSEALKTTSWTKGYIDANFDLKYRSFNVSSKTVLDFVFEIAETFNAIPLFDTIDKTVSLYREENLGQDRGLTVGYGNLLRSGTVERNTDEFATRIKVFGKNEISISSVNPTGSNYIENYGNFLYPFTRDVEKNVLTHSDFMTDSLCNALLDYFLLVESKQGEFETLLADKKTKQTTLTSQQNALDVLEDELAIIEDQISIANANGQSTTTLVANKTAKQTEITNQETLIATTNSEIAAIDTSITTLKNLLKVENNFTADELIEWNDFIIEKEVTFDSVDDEKQLYDLGLEKFAEVQEPKIIANISIVNLLECIYEQHNWDKLVLGDIVTIDYERFNLKLKAKIVEIQYNFESGDINVVLSNAKELVSDEERFLKELGNVISTSTSVNANKYKWDDAKASTDEISQIIDGTWDSAKRTITASNNESVEIGRKGIILKDPNDPLKIVILQHGVIGLSVDGGNNWKTAITGSHIVAERLLGKLILGNQMVIGDNDGTFLITGNLLTIKDTSDVVRLLLGEYDDGKYGLKILNKTGTATVLDEDGILQSYGLQEADNVDSTHPLKLKFYIPDETITIRKVLLNFSREAFRAYSTGASSGGSSSVTSGYPGSLGSGWGTTSYVTADIGGDSGHSTTSNSAGSHSHSASTGSEGSHNHGGSAGSHNHGNVQNQSYAPPISSDGSHSHSVSVGTDGGHSHTVYMPNHKHFINLDHTHTVNVPDHTHGIIYSIFESTLPTSISVTVNGVTTHTGINSDQANINIASNCIKGWNEILISSGALGRVNASLFIQVFLST